MADIEFRPRPVFGKSKYHSEQFHTAFAQARLLEGITYIDPFFMPKMDIVWAFPNIDLSRKGLFRISLMKKADRISIAKNKITEAKKQLGAIV